MCTVCSQLGVACRIYARKLPKPPWESGLADAPRRHSNTIPTLTRERRGPNILPTQCFFPPARAPCRMPARDASSQVDLFFARHSASDGVLYSTCVVTGSSISIYRALHAFCDYEGHAVHKQPRKAESGVAPVGAIGGAFDPSDWVVLQHLLRKVECKEKRPSPEHSESGYERCGSNGDNRGGSILPDGN